MQAALERIENARHIGKVLELERNLTGNGRDFKIVLELKEVDQEVIIGDGNEIELGDNVRTGDTIRLQAVSRFTAKWDIYDAEEEKEAKEKEEKNNKSDKKKRKTFNLDLLMSDKGLKVIIDKFPTIKFKGQGHESSDLHSLVSLYREWAYQMYPKLHFNRMVTRIEGFGSVRRLKDFLDNARENEQLKRANKKRKLLGLPVVRSGFEDEDEDEGVGEGEGDGDEAVDLTGAMANDGSHSSTTDQLYGDGKTAPSSSPSTSSLRQDDFPSEADMDQMMAFDQTHEEEEELLAHEEMMDDNFDPFSPPSSVPVPAPPVNAPVRVVVDDDMKKRMEENRRKAMEKVAARKKAKAEAQAQAQAEAEVEALAPESSSESSPAPAPAPVSPTESAPVSAPAPADIEVELETMKSSGDSPVEAEEPRRDAVEETVPVETNAGPEVEAEEVEAHTHTQTQTQTPPSSSSSSSSPPSSSSPSPPSPPVPSPVAVTPRKAIEADSEDQEKKTESLEEAAETSEVSASVPAPSPACEKAMGEKEAEADVESSENQNAMNTEC